MVKIEEVKLNKIVDGNGELKGSDLNSLKFQSEQINTVKLDDSSKVTGSNSKFFAKKNNRQGLFFKVLFFQFVVSSFVFLVLFSLKKVYPDKFKAVSAQLNLAIDDGPKFYEGLDLKINEFNKNFNLQKQNVKQNSNDAKQKNNSEENKLFNRNVSAIELPMKKEEMELQSESLNGNGLKLENNSEKIMIDDLESISRDDGDVFFFEFALPVHSNKVSSKFGPRINPLTKQKGDFHNGVDIPSSVGTPIWSIADGKVVRAAYSEKSGNFIIISHDNGYESRYAHCSKLLKKAGDLVKKCEKIALVGQTGNTTGPHLHVGFRKDGKWIDPKVVFPNYG